MRSSWPRRQRSLWCAESPARHRAAGSWYRSCARCLLDGPDPCWHLCEFGVGGGEGSPVTKERDEHTVRHDYLDAELVEVVVIRFPHLGHCSYQPRNCKPDAAFA